jgi:SAM-dependent methyltransferase
MSIANREQAEHWNREEARHWVRHQASYDKMFAPLCDILLDGAALRPGESVLDVGCGCGATTVAAARRVAPAPVVGVDLSGMMLDRAREIAAHDDTNNATFERADAQVHPFADQSYDVVISRLGVMFFADPVAAFTNLHRATRSGGRLAFVCWQDLAANEWLVVPGAALAQHVPLPDLGGDGATGMFAYADPDRARTTLGDAGWRDVTVTAHTTPILVGGTGTLDDAVEFLRTGSIGRTVLGDAEPAAATRAVAAVRDALRPYVAADGVRLDCAVWLITARR